MNSRLAILTVCLLLACVPARAAGSDDQRPPAGGSSWNCVQVEIGGDKAPDLDCLNQKLQDEVTSAAPSSGDATSAPLSATSASLHTGGFNQSAMSQQFGSNWGKSAVPFRPPAPIYGTPLRAGGAPP